MPHLCVEGLGGLGMATNLWTGGWVGEGLWLCDSGLGLGASKAPSVPQDLQGF